MFLFRILTTLVLLASTLVGQCNDIQRHKPLRIGHFGGVKAPYKRFKQKIMFFAPEIVPARQLPNVEGVWALPDYAIEPPFTITWPTIFWTVHIPRDRSLVGKPLFFQYVELDLERVSRFSCLYGDVIVP